MSFSLLFSCTTECNTLIKRYIITNDCCFTYYHTMSVVNEKSFTNLCSRMNFDTGLSCRFL